MNTEIEALKKEIETLKEQKAFLIQRLTWIRNSAREKFSWDRDRLLTVEVLTKIIEEMK